MQIRCSHGAVRRAERAPQGRGYSICEMGSISLTRITRHLSLVRVFLLLFASVIFTGASWANAQSQSDQAKESRVVQSPVAKRGLNFAVGARGLDSLSYNGQSLLLSPRSGELQPQKSVFRAALDAVLPRSSSQVVMPNKQTGTVDLKLPWGRISCAYGKQDDRLTMRIEVSNWGHT
jgi:hypothetical protein